METLANILAGADPNPYQNGQGINPLLTQLMMNQQMAPQQLGVMPQQTPMSPGAAPQMQPTMPPQNPAMTLGGMGAAANGLVPGMIASGLY